MPSRSLLEECRVYVAERTSEASRIVRAVWKVEYALGWRYAFSRAASDRPVLREFLLVECESTGSCHQEVTAASLLDYTCIGRDALDLAQFPLSYQIAALDAAAGSVLPSPDELRKVVGDGPQRLDARSDVIVDEAMRALNRRGGRAANVVVVGALESVIGKLCRVDGVRVVATDGNPTVIGSEYHGVRVLPATDSVRLVQQSDVAVVTGMVIATDTYDEIADAARSRGSHVVMFSQTGANLVPPMLQTGVGTVISEAYPFCFTGIGETCLRIYRSAAGP